MNGAKAGNAKESAKSFINLLSADATNRFGVVSFNKTATLLSGLSQDADSTINGIDAL